MIGCLLRRRRGRQQKAACECIMKYAEELRHAPAQLRALILGRQRAHELGRDEVIGRLAKAATTWNGALPHTMWGDPWRGGGLHLTESKKDDGSGGYGKRFDGTWTDFVSGLKRYGSDPESAHEDQDRLVISMATSSTGGGGDHEARTITALFADADGVGGYEQFAKAMEAAGLSVAVEARTSGGVPHFHAFVPYAEPLVVPDDYETWKREEYIPQYLYLLGVFSEVGELDYRAGEGLSKCGFDAATSRLLQPIRLYSDMQGPTHFFTNTGKALDHALALKLLGYEPPAVPVRVKHQVAKQARSPPPSPGRSSRSSVPSRLMAR